MVLADSKKATLYTGLLAHNPDLSWEFHPYNDYVSGLDFSANTPQDRIRFIQMVGYWDCTETIDYDRQMIFWAPSRLKYFKQIHGNIPQLPSRGFERTWLGAIILIDSEKVLSIIHGTNVLEHVDSHIPYVVAVKRTEPSKSWQHEFPILNHENTLTYHPNDKESIKQVWLEMIRHFELDSSLEKRFLDCLESKI